MEGGRSRRQTVVDGRGGKKFKNALAELEELRKTGGKRADRYEFKEEESVYDEVDDDEYARIVQKRREEGGGLFAFTFASQNSCGLCTGLRNKIMMESDPLAGGFVVGDDGLGYTDIGEEVDWVNEDAKAGAGRKAGKEIAAGPGNKRKAADPAVPGARARMQKMFQTASVKARPAKAAVDDKSTDALLDDILGNLDAAT